MVMDWNPIVSAGVGGLVGVLGSYVTQRAQTSREIRKMREDRGNDSAVKVLDGVNQFYAVVRKASHEEEIRGHVPGWPEVYVESDGFDELISKIRVDVLLIPSSSARKRAAAVTDVLGSSWFIGSRSGVDGDLVAIELSEYVRDVLGRYLRGQKQRPVPWRIRGYLRIDKSWSKEWEKKRKKEEKEKKQKAEEAQKRFKREGPPPLPAASPEQPPSPVEKTQPQDPAS